MQPPVDADVPGHVRVLVSSSPAMDEVLSQARSQAPTPPQPFEDADAARGQLMYEFSTLLSTMSGLQPEWAWDLVITNQQ